VAPRARINILKKRQFVIPGSRIKTSWPSSRESSSPYRLSFSDFCECLLINLLIQIYFLLIPEAAWSKAWVFNRLLAGIAGTNPAEAWVSVSCECCVLSGRVLGYGPIPRPEEFYRMWCVWVWSRNFNSEAWLHQGCRAIKKLRYFLILSSLRNCISYSFALRTYYINKV
jgi:hypothetical protein